MVLPARAVTTTAARTGASSRASASATTPPDHPLGGELPEADDGADGEGHPGEEADERHDEGRAGADEVERDEQLRQAIGRPHRPGQRLHAEDDGGAQVVEEREQGHVERRPSLLRGARGPTVAAECAVLLRSRRSRCQPSLDSVALRLAVEARDATRHARQHLPRDRVGVRGDLVGPDERAPIGPVVRHRSDRFG